MTHKAATPTPTIRVLLPLPLGNGYDYLPLTGKSLPLGTLVEVPFGSKRVIGVIWGQSQSTLPLDKLKAIIAVLELPPLQESVRNFIDWVANYTVTPSGAVLKMVFGSMKIIQLKKNDQFSDAKLDPNYHLPHLSDDQKIAVDHLVHKTRENVFNVTLLDGVTGSGKTEVFCEAIAETIRLGKQALVMLPEIAMTAALIDRFAARFGMRPTEWHSDLTEKQRRINWHSIMRGHAQFILGARSALFLPYPNLGLIVVDEEHEAAYKQEEGVIYHGRDMAVVRAHMGHIPIILSSATPSLETTFNVQQGKYDHVELRQRFGKAEMPRIDLIDLREQKLSSREFISAPLFSAIQKTIDNQQQSMLFLNRRGYAPLTLCRACGFRLKCPHCTSWLIEHKHSRRLHCHHCDFSMLYPKACPSCGVEDKLAACGPGVERVAEEIKKRLPDARVAIMASDMLDGPTGAQRLVEQMALRELDILIGTQIMAKGYHFPRLTLVGVVDADLGLAGGDPRAAERTFQLLQQMAGRSGRAEDAGQVYLQTTSPQHPVMQALIKGNRDDFMSVELQERETYCLPPFWRLASVTVAGVDLKQVMSMMERLASTAPRTEAIRVLGPAPAPFAILRGRHRHRLMLQAPRTINLSAVIRAWLGAVSIPHSLRIMVDVDPYSFL